MLLTRREPGEQYRVCILLREGAYRMKISVIGWLFVSCLLFATQEPQSHSVTQTGLQAGDVNAWRG